MRSNWIVRWLLVGIGVAFVVTGVLFGKGVLKADPLSGYRSMASPELGVRLKGVSFRHYEKNKLVASAEIRQVSVTQDRRTLDLIGISKGAVYGDSREPLGFESEKATYDSALHTLNINSGSRIFSKDVDLQAPQFTFEQDTGIVQSPNTISGKFFDGQVKATNLMFDTRHSTYHIAKVSWVGVLPKDELQEAGQDAGKPTTWTISGDNASGNKEYDTWTNGRASDQDLLVKAPLIKREKKTDTVTAIGDGAVYYFGKDANLVCDKAIIYRKEKKAVLTGHVHMLVKPKDMQTIEETAIEPFQPTVSPEVEKSRPKPEQTPEQQQQKDLEDELRSSKTARKYPMHVSSEKIVYWYAKGNRHAEITGNPQAYQELKDLGAWRKVWADTAHYDGEKDELTLDSDKDKQDKDDKRRVHMQNSLGDDLVGLWITISTEEDNDEWHGMYVGGKVVTSQTSDETEATKPKEKPGNPPPTTGGTPPPKTTGGG